MQLVESHIIKSTDLRFAVIDAACFASKNLYQDAYLGKRVKRGLFQASDGKQYNADVNGSYNIIRKVTSDAFVQGSRGCVVHPALLAV